MSKIKGIELKNIVEFKGHEGEELIQGNVYYNGKKVGFYSQDAWGGCDNLSIDYKLPSELKDEIKNVAYKYVGNELFKGIDTLYGLTYTNHKPIGYEYLFMDLLQLMEHEKLYKKYSKLWGTNKIYIIYDNAWDIRIGGRGLREEDANKVYYEYNGLEDFNIA